MISAILWIYDLHGLVLHEKYQKFKAIRSFVQSCGRKPLNNKRKAAAIKDVQSAAQLIIRPVNQGLPLA